MQPIDLRSENFAAYPPQARVISVQHLSLLQQLPLPLLPLLLRELSAYDWRFPREQRRIAAQLHLLSTMPSEKRSTLTAPFAALLLPPSLAATDWVNDAPGYMEQLTANLWSTHQMPAFRSAAEAYATSMGTAEPASAATSPRLVMVVLDEALGTPQQRSGMYRRLRKEGVLLDHVQPANGMSVLQEHLRQRSADGEAFANWYIDGAEPPVLPPTVATVSYRSLEPTRQRLLQRARDVMQAERSGPEELRTLMARLTPAEIGLDHDVDPTLAHFQLSLLTEGSGTQVFATTFVQWAARECLRRAEPQTVLACFTARQRQQGMNELLSGAPSTGLDTEGSLVDADQAAWYTWLNLQRLPDAQQARFLVWQQGQPTVVAIGPGLPRGTTSSSPLSMQQVLKLLA